jgi:hypothetical protein
VLELARCLAFTCSRFSDGHHRSALRACSAFTRPRSRSPGLYVLGGQRSIFDPLSLNNDTPRPGHARADTPRYDDEHGSWPFPSAAAFLCAGHRDSSSLMLAQHGRGMEATGVRPAGRWSRNDQVRIRVLETSVRLCSICQRCDMEDSLNGAAPNAKLTPLALFYPSN